MAVPRGVGTARPVRAHVGHSGEAIQYSIADLDAVGDSAVRVPSGPSYRDPGNHPANGIERDLFLSLSDLRPPCAPHPSRCSAYAGETILEFQDSVDCRQARIARLNDQLRRTLRGRRAMRTAGVQATGRAFVVKAVGPRQLALIRSFTLLSGTIVDS